jgi:hypothetical protein
MKEKKVLTNYTKVEDSLDTKTMKDNTEEHLEKYLSEQSRSKGVSSEGSQERFVGEPQAEVKESTNVSIEKLEPENVEMIKVS